MTAPFWTLNSAAAPAASLGYARARPRPRRAAGEGVSRDGFWMGTLSVEQLDDNYDAWRDLAGRSLEPNAFLEPGFALQLARHAPARSAERRRRGCGLWAVRAAAEGSGVNSGLSYGSATGSTENLAGNGAEARKSYRGYKLGRLIGPRQYLSPPAHPPRRSRVRGPWRVAPVFEVRTIAGRVPSRGGVRCGGGHRVRGPGLHGNVFGQEGILRSGARGSWPNCSRKSA